MLFKKRHELKNLDVLNDKELDAVVRDINKLLKEKDMDQAQLDELKTQVQAVLTSLEAATPASTAPTADATTLEAVVAALTANGYTVTPPAAPGA